MHRSDTKGAWPSGVTAVSRLVIGHTADKQQFPACAQLSPRASPPQSAESPAFVAHGQWQQFQQARQGGKGAAAAGAGALASAERGAAALALNAALFAELGGQAAPGTVL